MSITFTISNDTDKSIVSEYECYHCDGVGCSKCHSGKVIFHNSRWEMNLANGNATMLLSGLGFPVEDYCGKLNPNAVLAAIARTPVELLERSESVEGNMITCGVDLDRVNRYFDKLKEIALEAAKREEWIYWG